MTSAPGLRTRSVRGIQRGLVALIVPVVLGAAVPGGHVDVAGAATAVPSAPGTPSVASRNGQARVDWTAPASSGTSPISAYVVTGYIGLS